jgi:16S rRNA G527 N7-methylase RsmG
MFGKFSSIHKLNSHQPFAHGVWRNNNEIIGDEENLEGRNNLIISEFKKLIQEKFKPEEIKKLTLLDIGSYDGLTSIQIERLFPFKEIVSLEPRRKNFLKGEFIRNYLKIKTNVKFINDNLENINKKYDVIFCVGVLHHIGDSQSFIKKITSIADKLIFFEFLSYKALNKFSNFWLNKINNKIIEPKDIVYKFEKKLIGVSGFKYETNYSDGSTIQKKSIVNIPSSSYVEQILQTQNFNSNVILDGIEYFKHIKKKHRKFSACILSAIKNEKNDNIDLIDEYIFQYEKNYLKINLSWPIIFLISKINILIKLLPIFLSKNNFKREIIFNLRYNFRDKLNLEKAKLYIKEKKIYLAANCLFKVINSKNSDYRTCYRSFALLAKIYENKKNKKDYFLKLLYTCNENYNIKILDEI